MSNTVWDADKGWHDGAEVSVSLDSAGRIQSVPLGSVEMCHITSETDGALIVSWPDALGQRTNAILRPGASITAELDALLERIMAGQR